MEVILTSTGKAPEQLGRLNIEPILLTLRFIRIPPYSTCMADKTTGAPPQHLFPKGEVL